MSVQKRIVMIAGPNGAGKTTFAREYLPREANCPERVGQGGHDVPEEVIRRRFDSGLRNFRETYQKLEQLDLV